jgi:hypothetical protein
MAFLEKSMGPIDYDLHGLVGVRLLGASAGNAAAVDRQLGPIRAPLSRPPDITVRFVDRLPTREPLYLLGVGDAAFSDDAFLLLHGRPGTAARVQIPLERVGRPCEIVCERDVASVPFLLSIINFTALAKGVLPLHASAFIHDGVGVVATGWSRGGKTSLLLAFTARGASYVGDDWVYVADRGAKVYGLPTPVTISNSQLRQSSAVVAAVGWKTRMRLRAAALLADTLRRTASTGVAKRTGWSRLVRRALPMLRGQCSVAVPPDKLFGPGHSERSCRLDKLVFVINHDRPDVIVERASPREVAQRMAFSLREERMAFLSCYHKFRFAFPRRRNRIVEQAEETELALLLDCLAGKEAYAVSHPYPAEIGPLSDALLPLMQTTPASRRKPLINSQSPARAL